MKKQFTVKEANKYAGYKATPMRSPRKDSTVSLYDRYKLKKKQCGGG